jgi:hypothetical protein
MHGYHLIASHIVKQCRRNVLLHLRYIFGVFANPFFFLSKCVANPIDLKEVYGLQLCIFSFMVSKFVFEGWSFMHNVWNIDNLTYPEEIVFRNTQLMVLLGGSHSE